MKKEIIVNGLEVQLKNGKWRGVVEKKIGLISVNLLKMIKKKLPLISKAVL